MRRKEKIAQDGEEELKGLVWNYPPGLSPRVAVAQFPENNENFYIPKPCLWAQSNGSTENANNNTVEHTLWKVKTEAFQSTQCKFVILDTMITWFVQFISTYICTLRKCKLCCRGLHYYIYKPVIHLDTLTNVSPWFGYLATFSSRKRHINMLLVYQDSLKFTKSS